MAHFKEKNKCTARWHMCVCIFVCVIAKFVPISSFVHGLAIKQKSRKMVYVSSGNFTFFFKPFIFYKKKNYCYFCFRWTTSKCLWRLVFAKTEKNILEFCWWISSIVCILKFSSFNWLASQHLIFLFL